MPGPPPGAADWVGLCGEAFFEAEADGAGCAGAGAAAPGAGPGLVAEAALPEGAPDLFTPPWPLHAPRPLFVDVVPSLHSVGPPVLVGAAELGDALGAAEVAALLGAGAVLVAAAVAVLSMPP
jgi:hypothetical protein